jgi:hypothetical protein
MMQHQKIENSITGLHVEDSMTTTTLEEKRVEA